MINVYLYSIGYICNDGANITEYSDMNKENRNKNTDISARIAEILDYINESKIHLP